jgi:hypothetical protein
MARLKDAPAILTVMRRRVVALLLTLVVAGTPEALALCQVVCASSTSHADTASHQHSGGVSHHSAAPVSDASIIEANHDGCHRDQVSSLTVPTPERTTFATSLTTVVAILPPLSRVSVCEDTADANRSASVPLHTPLRI